MIQDADAILTGPGDSYVQIRRLKGRGHVLATRYGEVCSGGSLTLTSILIAGMTLQ